MLFFPTFLYGPTTRVRRTWRRLSVRAWNEGTWDGIMSEAEQVPLSEVHGPIVVCNDSRPWVTSDNVWQPNWVFDGCGVDPSDLHGNWKKQYDLTMQGMTFIWYAMGMLSRSFTGLYFTCHPGAFRPDKILHTEEHCNNVMLPWLAAYVHWLPELIEHAPRYRRASAGVGMMPYGAFVNLFRIACGCNLITLDQLRDPLIDETTGACVVQLLLKYGIIQSRHDRYVVVRGC